MSAQVDNIATTDIVKFSKQFELQSAKIDSMCSLYDMNMDAMLKKHTEYTELVLKIIKENQELKAAASAKAYEPVAEAPPRIPKRGDYGGYPADYTAAVKGGYGSGSGYPEVVAQPTRKDQIKSSYNDDSRQQQQQYQSSYAKPLYAPMYEPKQDYYRYQAGAHTAGYEATTTASAAPYGPSHSAILPEVNLLVGTKSNISEQ